MKFIFDQKASFDKVPTISPNVWMLIPNDPRERLDEYTYKFLSVRRGASFEFIDYKKEKVVYSFKKGSPVRYIETRDANDMRIFELHYNFKDLINQEDMNKIDPDEDLV